MRITNLKSNLLLYIILLITFSFSITNLYSLEDYKKLSFKSKIEDLGLQPTHIVRSGNMDYDVFCLGQDNNFDGKIDLDSGDVFSSWYRVRVDETVSGGGVLITSEKVMDFKDDIIQFGFKPVFDTLNSKIYLNCLNTVKILDANEKSIVNNDLFGGKFLGSSYVVLNIYNNKLVTTKYEFYQTDSIRVFEDYTLNTSVKYSSISCGNNTIASRFIINQNTEILLVLDQGTFGSPTSKIYSIFNYEDQDNLEIETDSLGNGANFIKLENINFNQGISVGYIVMSGDNRVNVGVFNGDEFDFILGEPGTYDGPREVFTMPDWNYVYVSTYGGKVFVFDKSFAISDKPNLLPIDTLSLNGKGESMNFYPTANHLFVLTPTNEFYAPINTIDVFYDPTFTSVEDNNFSSNTNDYISLYPNPIENNELLHISLENNLANKSISKYEIYDLNGNLVVNSIGLNLNNISIDLSNLKLISGKYFVKLQFENGFIVKPFSVR